MNHVQQRRPSRSQRALALALVIAVNGGIAGFIDRLAGVGRHRQGWRSRSPPPRPAADGIDRPDAPAHARSMRRAGHMRRRDAA